MSRDDRVLNDNNTAGVKKKWKAAVLWGQSTLGGRPDRTKEEPRMTEQ